MSTEVERTRARIERATKRILKPLNGRELTWATREEAKRRIKRVLTRAKKLGWIAESDR